MAGSIRPRPEKGRDEFELRVFLGRDANGKVRRRTRVFHGTRREAERELARMVIAQEDEAALVPTEASRPWGPSTTVNEAIEGWRANGWQDLSPSTTRRYASNVATHVKDSIGRRKIASLSRYDVEVYLCQLKARGLSEASVRQTRARARPAALRPVRGDLAGRPGGGGAGLGELARALPPGARRPVQGTVVSRMDDNEANFKRFLDDEDFRQFLMDLYAVRVYRRARDEDKP